MSNKSWEAIFSKYKILEHDFSKSPFELSASQIKTACQDFKRTAEKEVRILCKQDSRKDVPAIMKKRGLFLLPIRNGIYAIVKGEGYFEIDDIKASPQEYNSKLSFELETSKIGNSEMQHLDCAYAVSMVRSFFNDDSLVLTVRGRKYTPKEPGFSFYVGEQKINVQSVQTEVDAGYEGKNRLVLIEAKNSKTTNTIIRQLFYPYRQWREQVSKKVNLLFFEKREDDYMFWEYKFTDKNDYNSIKFVKFARYRLNK